MADLQAWENGILGQRLDTDGVKADAGQCSQVPLSWAKVLFPTASWSKLLPPLGSNVGIREWAGKSTNYFTWIDNNHADVNQLPLPGDIGVSGATPAKGFTDSFKNPDGHAWVFKSASPSGYTMIQQNGPNLGEGVNQASQPWNLIPVLGWFRDTNVNVPVPVPPAPVASPMVGKTIRFPKTDFYIPVFNIGGPYDKAHAIHALDPKLFNHELDYPILQDLGNGLYVINTQNFGKVVVAITGTDATIS